MDNTWTTPQPPEKRPMPLRVVVTLVVGGVVALLCFATAFNAFGSNIHGKVYCANGGVTGVFVEAERLPRIGSVELQSGFSDWSWHGPETNSAEFDHWLPFGGAYSIHFGCMPLGDGPAGGWGSDNRTPFIHDERPSWACNNPTNDREPTVIVTDCQPH